MAAFLLVNPRAGDAQPTVERAVRGGRTAGHSHARHRAGRGPGGIGGRCRGGGSRHRRGGRLARGCGSRRGRARPSLRLHPARHPQPLRARCGARPERPDRGLARLLGDIGRVNGRAFLNNVSLGAYAALVDEEERAGRFRAFLRIATRRRRTRLEIDGTQVSARIVVVGNNAYRLDPLALGVRERLDEGVLHLGVARGWLPRTWIDLRDTGFRIESGDSHLRAAVDGEVVRLEPPLDFAVEPCALRVLLPDP